MGAAAVPLMVAGGLISAKGAYDEGNNQKNYYNYLAGVSKQNEALSMAAGKAESETVGTQEAAQMKQIGEQGREMVGAQKAALAAGGAGAGSKTAEQILSDTLTKTDLDEQALRYNADLRMKDIRIGAQSKAFNYSNEAAGYSMAGKNAARAGKWSTAGSLLSTAGTVAKNYYAPAGKVGGGGR